MLHFDLNFTDICGRHFAAVERPKILVRDIREFFSTDGPAFNSVYRL